MPIRIAIGPSATATVSGSNPVDTLAMNRLSVTKDAHYGANNCVILQRSYSIN